VGHKQTQQYQRNAANMVLKVRNEIELNVMDSTAPGEDSVGKWAANWSAGRMHTTCAQCGFISNDTPGSMTFPLLTSHYLVHANGA
jgi:hypothetical protein